MTTATEETSTTMKLALSADDVENLLFTCALPPQSSVDQGRVRPIIKAAFASLPKDNRRILEENGGVNAVRSRAVQLLRKDKVTIALYSRTLPAAELVDKFLNCRDNNLDPKVRALALKKMLQTLANEHAFSVVLFDVSSRVFAASTSRSAPLSFGHADDGTVILTCSLPRSRTPIAQEGSNLALAHLPAGRFVYGHRYLRPCEFTSFWSSADASRAGVRTVHYDPAPCAPSPQPVLRTEPSPAFANKDTAALRSWRWADKGAECDRVSTWRKADAPAPKVAEQASVVSAAAITEKMAEVKIEAPKVAAPAPKAVPPMPARLREMASTLFLEGAMLAVAGLYGDAKATPGRPSAPISPQKRFLMLFVARTAVHFGKKLERSEEEAGAAVETMAAEVAAAQEEGVAKRLRRSGSSAQMLIRSESQRRMVTVMEEGVNAAKMAFARTKQDGLVRTNSAQQIALTRGVTASSLLRNFSGSNFACQVNGTCCFNGVCYI